MQPDRSKTIAQQTTPAAAAPEEGSLHLKLFVAGHSPRSQLAIRVLSQLCDQHLHGGYRLEVIDIYQQPALARQEQIIATPTLIKYAPQPKKLLVGDLSQTERVLAQLGLMP